MRNIVLLLSFLCLGKIGFCADYYWIGGTGNWTDISHWATSSGGSTVHSSAPSGADNVYFDINSFSATGQTVTLNIAASCNDMIWTGSLYSPTFAGSQDLTIDGDLAAISAMSWSQSGSRTFTGADVTIDFKDLTVGGTYLYFNNTGTISISKSGVNLNQYLYFDGNATFNINTRLMASRIYFQDGNINLSDSIVCSSLIEIHQDTFNTNNNNIHCGYLYTNGSTPLVLITGTSHIYADRYLNNYRSSYSSWTGYTYYYLIDINNANAEVDFSQTTFHLDGAQYNTFHCSLDSVDFHDIQINLAATDQARIDVADHSTFNDLHFNYGNIDVTGGYSNFKNIYADRIYIYGGGLSHFDSIFITSTTSTSYFQDSDSADYISCLGNLTIDDNGIFDNIIVTGNLTIDDDPTINTANVTGDFTGDNTADPNIAFLSVSGNFSSLGAPTLDTLILTKQGSVTNHSFASGKTTTINDSVSITSNGCFKANVQATSSGSSATISMPTGKSFSTDFINLKDITATGGATFNAGANSSDLGNNTGWTFTGSTYTLSLAYNYACISPTGTTEVKMVVDGPASNFWWQETTTPFDTFNTNIDTVMAAGQAKYVFVQEYGTNCTLEDTVYINVRTNANGVAQVFRNNVGDEDWDNCSNWDLGYIPDSLSDVTVANGDTVILTSDTSWCKDLTINGVLLQTGGVLMVHGSIYNYGNLNSTAGDIIISGSGIDSISGTDSIHINSLKIDKEGAMAFGNVLNVTGYAEFINGILYTYSNALLHFSSGSDNNKGADSSFIDGPVSYTGSTAISFPVGDSIYWAPIRITDPLISGDVSTWEAQYFAKIPIDTGSYTNPVKKISHVEYWQLDKLAGTGSVRVSLAWKDDNRSGIVNHSLLRVMKYDGSAWQDMGRSGSGGTAPAGWLRSNYISSFSPFTFGTTNNLNYLPAEFININARWSSNDAMVTWETASEQNNSHFEIERSIDGASFTKVGVVASQNSNSTSILSYEFIDADVYHKTKKAVYYRIKQIDFDGKFDFSHILSLTKLDRSSFKVFPNPSNGQITLTSKSIGSVSVTDVFGKQILLQKAGEGQTKLDLSNARKGVYFIQYKIDGNSVETKRIIIR